MLHYTDLDIETASRDELVAELKRYEEMIKRSVHAAKEREKVLLSRYSDIMANLSRMLMNVPDGFHEHVMAAMQHGDEKRHRLNLEGYTGEYKPPWKLAEPVQRS